MITDDTCSDSPLGPSKDCSVEITFSPRSEGLKNAIFTTRTDDPGTSALNVGLSGQAISPPSNNGGGGGGGGCCFIDTLRY